MPLPPLSSNEHELIRCAVEGLRCDLTGSTPEVRAEVLRVLLIRAQDAAVPKYFYKSNSHRWIIQGALFEQCLNLTDGRLLDGGALPALEFIGCVFQEGFCADNAHLERLEFKDCKFGAPLCNPAACMLPPHTGISNTAAPSPASAPARSGVDASDTQIAPAPGSVEAVGATPTEAPAADSEAQFENTQKPPCNEEKPGENQISLRNVRILGELRITAIEPLRALDKGGLLRVDARSARIGASAILRKLALRAPKNFPFTTPHETVYALNLRNAEIRADLFLEPGVDIDGGVILTGAHIGGDVRAHGLTAKDGYDDACRNDLRPYGWLRYAISLQSARIDGNIYAGTLKEEEPFTVEGVFDLGSMHLAGNLLLRGRAVIDPKKTRELAMTLELAKVSGDTALNIETKGLLLLDGAAVGGSLTLEGTLPRLRALNLSVGGDATLSLEVGDLVDLSGASISGQLDLRQLRMVSHTRGASNPREASPDFNKAQGSMENAQSEVPPSFLMVDADVKRALLLGIGSVTYICHRLTKPLCYPRVEIIEVWAIVSVKGRLDMVTISLLVENGNPAIVLTGQSNVFHSLNSKGLLEIDNDDKKKDYLRLFCAYVWGEEGSFQIIEKESQVPPLKDKKPPKPHEIALKDETPESTDADAMVRYADHLFGASFRIYSDGRVEMRNDKPLGELDPKNLPKYQSPLRYPQGEQDDKPDYASDRWESSDDEDALELKVQNWATLFGGPVTDFGNAFVNLNDASCGTLADADGAAWGGDSLMDLTNFTYARVPAPEEGDLSRVPSKRLLLWENRLKVISESKASNRPIPAREKYRAQSTLNLLKADSALQWLWLWAVDEIRFEGRGYEVSSLPLPVYRRRQWLANRGPQIDFHPQPYAQLAQVLRSEGDEDSARKIEKEKIRLEFEYRLREASKHRVKVVWLFFVGWQFLYGRFFGYGLSVLRALMTLFLFWFLGASFFLGLNKSGMLTKTEARVATVNTHNYLQQALKPDGVVNSPAAVSAPIVPASITMQRAIHQKLRHHGRKCAHPTHHTIVKPSSTPEPPRLTDSTTSAQDNRQTNAEFPCGRDINPLLYAVESATPFLNLHQQTRCDIRTPDDKAPWYCGRNWLECGKLFYQIIGYLITSLAVLTFSGIARRWEQK